MTNTAARLIHGLAVSREYRPPVFLLPSLRHRLTGMVMLPARLAVAFGSAVAFQNLGPNILTAAHINQAVTGPVPSQRMAS